MLTSTSPRKDSSLKREKDNGGHTALHFAAANEAAANSALPEMVKFFVARDRSLVHEKDNLGLSIAPQVISHGWRKILDKKYALILKK